MPREVNTQNIYLQIVLGKMEEENNIKKRKWYHLKDFHKVSLLNSAFSMFFNLLPFWGGLLLTISIGKWTDWSRFYSNGEFYLYSVSLISSSYLIYHNNKLKTTDLSSVFSIISLFLIVIISILYASLTANPEPQINVFIKWASIIAIFSAIPIFFHSQIISNRNTPNVGETRIGEQETIMQGLK
ncbi:hypothetical protein C7447_102260 [Tenacibaculum adriaticum]|uniref:Uncharacterized protein n=2 Tax=Tenacibaculum adriaticum TaxID=413713 RepID=A0A5S5DVY2_9FLAO|nr:hypothetical protein C7447_102260 [Tenacibaculum adriaticum]